MKLLFCTRCRDIFLLTTKKRFCHCGFSGGCYVTKKEVEVIGPCHMIGISNNTFHASVILHHWRKDSTDDEEKNKSTPIEAFFIPETATSIKRIDK